MRDALTFLPLRVRTMSTAEAPLGSVIAILTPLRATLRRTDFGAERAEKRRAGLTAGAVLAATTGLAAIAAGCEAGVAVAVGVAVGVFAAAVPAAAVPLGAAAAGAGLAGSTCVMKIGAGGGGGGTSVTVPVRSIAAALRFAASELMFRTAVRGPIGAPAVKFTTMVHCEWAATVPAQVPLIGKSAALGPLTEAPMVIGAPPPLETTTFLARLGTSERRPAKTTLLSARPMNATGAGG